MRTLGDLFPDTDKHDYLRERMAAGTVFYLFCSFTTPPKDKYLALAFVPPDVIRTFMFIINSKVNDYIANRPHLLACQVKLLAADYEFLSHDCYVDCARIVDHFRYEDVAGQVLPEVSRIKGQLSHQTKQEVVRVIGQSRTLTGEQKRSIISALS